MTGPAMMAGMARIAAAFDIPGLAASGRVLVGDTLKWGGQAAVAFAQGFQKQNKEGTWLETSMTRAMKRTFDNMERLAAAGGKAVSESFLQGIDAIRSGDPGASFAAATDAMTNAIQIAGQAGQAIADVGESLDRFGPLAGAAGNAIGMVTSAMSTFSDTGGQYLGTLAEIGDTYLQLRRTLAESTLDLGQVNAQMALTQEIMAGGAVDHFEDVSQSIGRFARGLNIAGPELREFTETYAAMAEIIGSISPTNIAGVLNAYIPDDAASRATYNYSEQLTRFTNIIRATGGNAQAMVDSMIRVGPAMRALGYDAGGTALFFGSLIEKGLRGQKLVYGMNQIVEKLHDGVQSKQFKNLEDGWSRLLNTVKALQAAGQGDSAIALLSDYTTPANAALLNEAIQKGVIYDAKEMAKRAGEGFGQSLSEAASETSSLSDIFENLQQQFEAAISPVGLAFDSFIISGGNKLVAWLAENQLLVAEWAQKVADFFIRGFQVMLKATGDMLVGFSEVVNGMVEIVGIGVMRLLDIIRLPADFLGKLDWLPGNEMFKSVGDGLNGINDLIGKIRDTDLSKPFREAGEWVTDLSGKLTQVRGALSLSIEDKRRMETVEQALKIPMFDEQGKPVLNALGKQDYKPVYAPMEQYQKDDKGEFKLDAQGQKIPVDIWQPMIQIMPGMGDRVKQQLKALGIEIALDAGKTTITSVEAKTEEARKAWEAWINSRTKVQLEMQPVPMVNGVPLDTLADALPGGEVEVKVVPDTSALEAYALQSGLPLPSTFGGGTSAGIPPVQLGVPSAPGAGGVIPEVNWGAELAKNFGLSLASGLRPGDKGFHGMGHAGDYSNQSQYGPPTPQMLNLANYVADNLAQYVDELIFETKDYNGNQIFAPFTKNIGDGRYVGAMGPGQYYNRDQAGYHGDHVHIAWKAGALAALQQMGVVPAGAGVNTPPSIPTLPTSTPPPVAPGSFGGPVAPVAPTAAPAASTGDPKQDIANYIISKAMSLGFTREQANAFLIQAFGESGLDPTASNPAGWKGIFQFDQPTWMQAGGGNILDAKQNIDNYFRLAAQRNLTPQTFTDAAQLGTQVSIGGPYHPENQAKGHLQQAMAGAQRYINNYGGPNTFVLPSSSMPAPPPPAAAPAPPVAPAAPAPSAPVGPPPPPAPWSGTAPLPGQSVDPKTGKPFWPGPGQASSPPIPAAAPAPAGPSGPDAPAAQPAGWQSDATGNYWYYQDKRGTTFFADKAAGSPPPPPENGVPLDSATGYWQLQNHGTGGKKYWLFLPNPVDVGKDGGGGAPAAPPAPSGPPKASGSISATGTPAKAGTIGGGSKFSGQFFPSPSDTSAFPVATAPGNSPIPEKTKVGADYQAKGERAFEQRDRDLQTLPDKLQSAGKAVYDYLNIAPEVTKAAKDIAKALTGPSSFTWSNLGRNVIDWFGNLKSQVAEEQIGRATGGPVFGAGTATSDSIPAWLSNGEFVHNTAAVQHYGMDFMHAVNQRKLPKFATGGLVGYSDGGPADISSMPGFKDVQKKILLDALLGRGPSAEAIAAADQAEWIALQGMVGSDLFRNSASMPRYSEGGLVEGLLATDEEQQKQMLRAAFTPTGEPAEKPQGLLDKVLRFPKQALSTAAYLQSQAGQVTGGILGVVKSSVESIAELLPDTDALLDGSEEEKSAEKSRLAETYKGLATGLVALLPDTDALLNGSEAESSAERERLGKTYSAIGNSLINREAIAAGRYGEAAGTIFANAAATIGLPGAAGKMALTAKLPKASNLIEAIKRQPGFTPAKLPDETIEPLTALPDEVREQIVGVAETMLGAVGPRQFKGFSVSNPRPYENTFNAYDPLPYATFDSGTGIMDFTKPYYEDLDQLAQRMAEDAATGYSPRLGTLTPTEQIAVHEFIHAWHNRNAFNPVHIEYALRNAFIEKIRPDLGLPRLERLSDTLATGGEPFPPAMEAAFRDWVRTDVYNYGRASDGPLWDYRERNLASAFNSVELPASMLEDVGANLFAARDSSLAIYSEFKASQGLTGLPDLSTYVPRADMAMPPGRDTISIIDKLDGGAATMARRPKGKEVWRPYGTGGPRPDSAFAPPRIEVAQRMPTAEEVRALLGRDFRSRPEPEVDQLTPEELAELTRIFGSAKFLTNAEASKLSSEVWPFSDELHPYSDEAVDAMRAYTDAKLPFSQLVFAPYANQLDRRTRLAYARQIEAFMEAIEESPTVPAGGLVVTRTTGDSWRQGMNPADTTGYRYTSTAFQSTSTGIGDVTPWFSSTMQRIFLPEGTKAIYLSTPNEGLPQLVDRMDYGSYNYRQGTADGMGTLSTYPNQNELVLPPFTGLSVVADRIYSSVDDYLDAMADELRVDPDDPAVYSTRRTMLGAPGGIGSVRAVDMVADQPAEFPDNWYRALLQAGPGKFGLGNAVPPFATGGPVFGPGTGTSDSVAAWLSDGEFVHNAAAVSYYGPDFMHAVNSMRLPRFAPGGPVGDPAIPPSIDTTPANTRGMVGGNEPLPYELANYRGQYDSGPTSQFQAEDAYNPFKTLPRMPYEEALKAIQAYVRWQEEKYEAMILMPAQLADDFNDYKKSYEEAFNAASSKRDELRKALADKQARLDAGGDPVIIGNSFSDRLAKLEAELKVLDNKANQEYNNLQGVIKNNDKNRAKQNELAVSGPPSIDTGKSKSGKSDRMAEDLGAGLVKGVLQGLGFPDVFGDSILDWGIYKMGMGTLGFGLEVAKNNGLLPSSQTPGVNSGLGPGTGPGIMSGAFQAAVPGIKDIPGANVPDVSPSASVTPAMSAAATGVASGNGTGPLPGPPNVSVTNNVTALPGQPWKDHVNNTVIDRAVGPNSPALVPTP